MWLIAQIQRWATIVPDYVVAGIVLLVAAAATLASGLLRSRAATRQWLPGVAFVTLGAVSMLLATGPAWRWPRGVVLAAAAAALLIHALADDDQHGESTDERHVAMGTRLCYPAMALLGAAVFLFYNLSGYSGEALLTWEGTVVLRFGEAFAARQPVAQFTLQRFLWDDGVLSAGNSSLFYGAPTYALFHTAGFSPWTLRCAAVVATLLSVVLAFVVAQRFLGPLAGAAMAVLFALNPCVLFYGRYGSSTAGTLLAVLLALLATWFFLEREQSAWWRAAICAAALYLATLQYSPARIFVLILLAFIPIGLAYQRRKVGWRRLAGVGVIAVVAVGVWRLESSFRRQGFFLNARGETFFNLLHSRDYIKSLYGSDPVPPHIHPGALSGRDRLELLGRALRITVPQYLKFMLPALAPPARGAVMTNDPPPLHLYYGPFGVFILWGAAHSVRRWRSWPRACLLLLVVLGTGPLLLTNRVDAHRLMVLVIPLSLLAALGVWEAARVIEKATVPRFLQHVFAIALAACAAYSAVNVLDYEYPPQSPASRAMVAEVASVPGSVVLGVDGMQRETGWVYLEMLERARHDPGRPARLLEERIIRGVQPPVGDPRESYLRELQQLSTTATILLAPADNFRQVAAELGRRGARVAERGMPQFHLLRIDGGAGVTGVGGDEIAVLPTPVSKPTPTPALPVQLRQGLQLPLTQLKPLAVTFGFAPPKVDRSWDGGPIRMGGVTYGHGLGTHAWCRMTYAVPAGATAFQAIVGLSDSIRTCEIAAVTFEVHDDHDRLLYDSGLVDTTIPPKAVYVRLGGTRTITLAVTEGGNGRDCDHALWALPAFLLQPK